MTSATGSVAVGPPRGVFAPSVGAIRAASRIGGTAAMLTAVVWLGRTSAEAAGQPRDEPKSAASASAGPSGAPAIVLELFTSQGCSTCPPADRLLAKLAGQAAPKVVALAFHVDFWNHAGWTDPFSRHEWTERQIAYARKFGLRQVYTPQAVIEGSTELVGSDESGIAAALAAAAARPAAQITLRLETSPSEILVNTDVEAPDALRGRKLTLNLVVYETGLVTSVEKGENGGSVLHDDYVVRSLRSGPRFEAGSSGKGMPRVSLSLSKDWNLSRLGVAAFLQDPRSLEICGATTQSLAGAPTASGGGKSK